MNKSVYNQIQNSEECYKDIYIIENGYASVKDFIDVAHGLSRGNSEYSVQCVFESRNIFEGIFCVENHKGCLILHGESFLRDNVKKLAKIWDEFFDHPADRFELYSGTECRYDLQKLIKE